MTLLHAEECITERYIRIVEHYVKCFELHGATPKGVDWPKADDVDKRFSVMLDVIRTEDRQRRCSILDLGCGYGAFKQFIDGRTDQLDYSGIDLAAPLIEAARRAHPTTSFELRDIVAHPLPSGSFDYVIMNGLLTVRVDLTKEEMAAFAKRILIAAFSACRKGIAFNVMNAHVDWQRDDLFHWTFDELAQFLKAELSRHYSFRADYGLYEYTCFVYKEPTHVPGRHPAT